MDGTHQSRHTLRVYVFLVTEVDGNVALDQVSNAVLESADQWILFPDVLKERMLYLNVANYVRISSPNSCSSRNEASRLSSLFLQFPRTRRLWEITVSS